MTGPVGGCLGTTLTGSGRACGDQPDPAELAAIQVYGLALAPVDLAGQQEHLAGRRREVTTSREQAFVDAHRAEPERYRKWLADTRGDGG